METQRVSSKDLGNILRVSPRRIEQLASEGIVVRVERGLYDLSESVGRYCDGLRATAEVATSTASTELQQERLKTIRMRNAERERQLITMDEASDIIDRLTGSFVAAIGGLPAQITDKAADRRRIELIIDATRQKLADDFAKIAGHAKSQ